MDRYVGGGGLSLVASAVSGALRARSAPACWGSLLSYCCLAGTGLRYVRTLCPARTALPGRKVSWVQGRMVPVGVSAQAWLLVFFPQFSEWVPRRKVSVFVVFWTVLSDFVECSEQFLDYYGKYLLFLRIESEFSHQSNLVKCVIWDSSERKSKILLVYFS